MKLSKDFDEAEFACPCCGLDGISPAVVDILQKIRDAVKRPIVVTSGVRCRKHNREVGGVARSAHMSGFAADFYAEDMSAAALGAYVKALYKCGDIPALCYCYLINGSDGRAVHIDVDAGKSRKNRFGF